MEETVEAILNVKDLIPRESVKFHNVSAMGQIFSCSRAALGGRGKPCL